MRPSRLDRPAPPRRCGAHARSGLRLARSTPLTSAAPAAISLRSLWGYRIMKQTPTISERKVAVVIWIGTVVFTLGAVLFGR
jgi:hypothetical protein